MLPYMIKDGDASSSAIYYDLDHAVKQILNRTPYEIAESAGVSFDEEDSSFTFASLGQSISVTYPDCKVTFTGIGEAPVTDWQLPILHYLAVSDGFPLSGKPVAFRDINKYTAHPENFENDTGGKLSRYFNDKPGDKIKQACTALGGEIVEGSADLNVRFGYMPRFMIYFKLWYSDDEFPASGKFLFDRHCTRYLEEMDIQISGPLLADFLIKQYKLIENG